eukprot:CAMPEP_0180340028 /NCGR_PEP_ID=MMETSP0989-20121125/437_1 /TAXON_ID=697907 /ORGANISM="non described non described, Strain CCMP2293" /LENGTH=153 /DNA_ID=CAMNT_0022328697 /DNA_START=53 /DNA_END=511 /DNA_ORIENTATION=+
MTLIDASNGSEGRMGEASRPSAPPGPSGEGGAGVRSRLIGLPLQRRTEEDEEDEGDTSDTSSNTREGVCIPRAGVCIPLRAGVCIMSPRGGAPPAAPAAAAAASSMGVGGAVENATAPRTSRAGASWVGGAAGSVNPHRSFASAIRIALAIFF